MSKPPLQVKDKAENPFIVAIGASAGGLEAIHELFDKMPPDTGFSFVIIQHLSADHKSMIVELLSKHTKMAVLEAADGLVLEPNKIYVIPNDRNILLEGGSLRLVQKGKGKAPNMAIDIFLESLASDQKDKAVAVILSGTGSDGSKGIQAIKDNGGVVFVQEPQSAKFDGMPLSAIATGKADFILMPGAIPDELINVRGAASLTPFKIDQLSEADEKLLSDILRIIKTRTGNDFANYKRPTIVRRLGNRMVQMRKKTLKSYLTYLLKSVDEAKILSKEFLIGVTQFFRDPEAFEQLRLEIIPDLLERKDRTEPVKVWVIGCSTGEEAYSIAILFKEYLEKAADEYDVKIFASDIDKDALNAASKGIYSRQVEKTIRADRLEKYFVPEGDQYRVKADIRKMIIFSHHDMMKDAPYSKMDLVTCRNMLIYLNASMQKRFLNVFHFSLNVGGYLFVGPSESIGDLKPSFKEISKKWKIFQSVHQVKSFKLDALSTVSPLEKVQSYVTKFPSQASQVFQNLLTDAILLQSDAAAIYIDQHLNLIDTFGNYRKYLSAPGSKLNMNLLKWLPSDMAIILSANIRQAIKTNTQITLNNLRNKLAKQLNVIIQPFELNAQPHALLIFYDQLFSKVPPSDHEQPIEPVQIDHFIALERELTETKNYLQNAIEESETANEELQSANEELISANEELQSTNEELQSLNEELHTVNAEHQQKIKEVMELNDDLNNYMRSTDIGQVFIDSDFKIRKFTPAATRIINLIETDIGRPISHISNNMKYEHFFEDLKNVLQGTSFIKRNIQLFDKSWHQIKITPYLKEGKIVDGVVLTFVDVTDIHNMAQTLEQEREYFKAVLENVGDGIMACDENGRLTYVNKALRNFHGLSHAHLELDKIDAKYVLCSPDGAVVEKDHDPLKKTLDGHPLKDVELILNPATESQKTFIANGRKVTSSAGHELGAVIALHDITERKKAYEEQQRLKALIDNSFDFIGLADLAGQTIYLNQAARKVIGIEESEHYDKLHLADFFPPEMTVFIKETVLPIVHKHRSWAGDMQFRHRGSGELIAVSWNVFLVSDEVTEKPIGIGFVSQDLRDKKKAEGQIKAVNEALKKLNAELEERVESRTAQIGAQKKVLQNLFMQAPALICTLKGPSHIYELVNPSYQQLFSKRELLGKPVLEALPELKGQGIIEILDQVYQTGKTFVGKEIKLDLDRRNTGVTEAIYFNFIYQSMFDEDSQVSGILVFAYEVTDQVKARHEIQEAYEELQKLAQEFHFVTDFMPQMVWATLADGYHDFYNKGWYEYTGLTYEQTKGEGWNAVLHPDDQQRAWELWSRCLKTGEPYEIEYRFRRHDGQYRWFLGRALPLKDDKGKILKWFGTCTDIHDQKIQSDQLENKVKERTRELQQSNEIMRRSNEELEQFAYIASHDLQEPLRKIRTFIGLLETELRDNISENARLYFDKTKQSAKKMTELVRDILNYSRLQQIGPKFLDTDLNDILGSVLEDLELLIKQKNAKIIKADLPKLKVIPLQISQLFYNVLCNSLKFTHDEIAPEIVISAYKLTNDEILDHPNLENGKDYWKISVSDNGIGFDQKYADKIFTIFQQLNPKTQFEGTGIGLALCKKIMDNHAGIISAVSSEGKGATFNIIIPEMD
jgi:two-component system, chemotaxis family, CheB/CheR fusion protein